MIDEGEALPLTGVRVLDLTNLLPGPYATMVLGDFGAEIIKVERPGGDPGRWSDPTVGGESTRHRMINRNKQSVSLDLKDPKDVEEFLALAVDADVVIEGFRPGVMDRLGLGFNCLSTLNNRLIYCAISGYGQDAPSRAGHDLNFMAEAGLLPTASVGSSLTPLPNTQYADLVGGSMRAVIGILLAMRERDHSGLGQFVDVGMLAGAMQLQVEMLAYHSAGLPAKPSLTRLTGAYPCYRLYPSRDGRLIAVAATERHFWENLCALLGLPDLIDQQYAQGEFAQSAIDVMSRRFSEEPLFHWAGLLEGSDTCTSPVLNFDEAMALAKSRDGSPLWSIDGTQQFSGLVDLSRTPARYRSPAPALKAEASREVPRWSSGVRRN